MAGVEGKVSVVIDSVSSLLAVAGQGGIQAVSSKLRRLASSIKVLFPPLPIPPPSHIDGNHPSPPPYPARSEKGASCSLLTKTWCPRGTVRLSLTCATAPSKYILPSTLSPR